MGQITWRGDVFTERLYSQIEKKLEDLGEQCADRARERAPVRHFDKDHKRASPPSHASGTLRRSIYATKASRSEGRISVRVGSSAPYAVYVEFGTRDAEAQPFLLPALAETEAEMTSLLKSK